MTRITVTVNDAPYFRMLTPRPLTEAQRLAARGWTLARVEGVSQQHD